MSHSLPARSTIQIQSYVLTSLCFRFWKHVLCFVWFQILKPVSQSVWTPVCLAEKEFTNKIYSKRKLVNVLSRQKKIIIDVVLFRIYIEKSNIYVDRCQGRRTGSNRYLGLYNCQFFAAKYPVRTWYFRDSQVWSLLIKKFWDILW